MNVIDKIRERRDLTIEELELILTTDNKASIEYANNAQRSVNRVVCHFRRDLLTAIAKPGWFEQ